MKPLVAVELQLRSDPLFFRIHCQMYGVQDKIDRLLSTGLISDNAVIVQIPNHGQIEHPLFGVDIGDICDPLLIGCICLKVSIEEILVFMDLLSHLSPFSTAADFG